MKKTSIICVLLLCIVLLNFTVCADDLPTIPINTSPVVSIKLTSVPKKLTYFVGEDIDVTGGVLVLTHKDGKTETYKLVRSWCGDIDSYSPGKVTVFVDYPNRQGYSGVNPSFTVNFITPEVSKISVEKLPDKTEYYTGDKFETNGIQVFAEYTNGDRFDITNEVKFSGFDGGKAGKQEIICSYTAAGKTVTTSFNVYVTQLGVVSAKVTVNPARIEFIEGEELSLEGIEVTLHYNDGKDVAVSDLSELSCEGFNPKKLGEQHLRVYCRGAAADLTVKVVISATHTHTPGELTLAKKPNCTEEGVSYAYCTVCGEIASAVLADALGHEWGEWKIKEEPTVELEGKRERICSVCYAADIEKIEPLSLSFALEDLSLIYSDGQAFPAGTSARGLKFVMPENSSSISDEFRRLYEYYADLSSALDGRNEAVIAVYSLNFSSFGDDAELDGGVTVSVPAALQDCESAYLSCSIQEIEQSFDQTTGRVTLRVNDAIPAEGMTFAVVAVFPEETTAEPVETEAPETTEAAFEPSENAKQLSKTLLIAAVCVVFVTAAGFIVSSVVKKRRY